VVRWYGHARNDPTHRHPPCVHAVHADDCLGRYDACCGCLSSLPRLESLCCITSAPYAATTHPRALPPCLHPHPRVHGAGWTRCQGGKPKQYTHLPMHTTTFHLNLGSRPYVIAATKRGQERKRRASRATRASSQQTCHSSSYTQQARLLSSYTQQARLLKRRASAACALASGGSSWLELRTCLAGGKTD
jgi:hypothetical protein